MTYNILSFDGGGIRGAYSAALVREIASEVGDFLSGVHLFAGTSIGSANALALASGASLDALVGIYVEGGHEIFGRRVVPKGPLGWLARGLERLPVIGHLVDQVDALMLPRWENRGLEKVLEEHFGGRTLGDLGPKIVLPTCRLDQPRNGVPFTAPVLLNNFEERDRELSLTDAMMRSGAAPTYFPSHQGFVDGGLFANNPSMVAFATAVDPKLGGQDPEDVRVLSIGTGMASEGITAPQPLMWGLLQWGPKIYDVSSTTVSELDSYQATQILGPRYRRVNTVMDPPVALDDWRAVPRLLDLARQTRESEAFRSAVEFVKDWVC